MPCIVETGEVVQCILPLLAGKIQARGINIAGTLIPAVGEILPTPHAALVHLPRF